MAACAFAAAPAFAAPRIEVTPARLEPPPVTIGDTIAIKLDVANRGDAVLTVRGIETPAGMWVEPLPPVLLDPDSVVRFRIGFAPSDTGTHHDSLIVRSDDPAAPAVAVAWESRVLPLAFETLALTTGSSTVPIGESIVVQAIPAEGVTIESMTLHHRSGDDTTFETVPMTWNRRWFIGIIPGSQVREGGVDYYVTAQNGAHEVTDPLEGDRRPFRLEVERPREFELTPVPRNPGFASRTGENIDFILQLARGTVFQSGTLWFRRGGETEYRGVDILEISFTGIAASIPGTEVGPTGVEYWAEIHTLTTNLFEPQNDPEQDPIELRIGVDNLVEPTTTPGGRYRLLSIPLEPPTGTNLATMLADHAEFGSYDPSRWRAFRWVPELGANVELSQDPAPFAVVPGRAYWLVSRSPHRIDTAPAPSLSSPLESFTILLAPGWNAIGNPYAFPIAWSAVQSSHAVGPPIAFDAERNDYVEQPADSLQPFQGYFVENTSASEETLTVSGRNAPGRRAAPAAAVQHADAGDVVRLEAVTARGADRSNVIGVAAGADDERDPLDQREPPPAPGSLVRLSLANRGWSRSPGLYRRDLRPPGAQGHAWDFEVASETRGEPVELVITGAFGALGESMQLIDREQGTVVPVAPDEGGAFRHTLLSLGPDRPYRLTLRAGTSAFVRRDLDLADAPARLTLDAPSPNPARGALRIRFGLPRGEDVRLEVFDLNGRRVATLLDGRALPAGFHAVVWRGAHDAGGSAPSGVYFYRLTAGGETQTRRATLVR